MLFESIFNDAKDQDEMREGLDRRVNYLSNRAQIVQNRLSPPSAEVPWLNLMSEATLWMEAAESAVMLNEMPKAKDFLRKAIRPLLRLQLPFGVALQRSLLSEDIDLKLAADNAQRPWISQWKIRTNGDDTISSRSDGDSSGFGTFVHESPQQWAYFVLAEALSEAANIEKNKELEKWALVPVGRMRLPLDQYRKIADFCERSIQQVNNSQDSKIVRGKFGDITELEKEVTTILAGNLVSLFRALYWSSKNTYLWKRTLAPAPWFDLDAALLIGAILKATANRKETPLNGVAHEVSHDREKRYANDFITVVRALGNYPEPDGRNRGNSGIEFER
jgi:hypothetical protein